MDRLDEPRSPSKSGVSVDELGRLFGQLLKQRVPGPPSNVKYRYDYMATIQRNSMSFKERADRFYEDKNPPPVPPVPESIRKAAAFKVTKTSETISSHGKRDLSMSDHNASFCKPCRRIFDGNGSFVQPLTKLEKGLHYSHWDRRLLERSARSCPLCLLLDRAVGTPVTANELLPAHYEIVQFLLAENVYGIRFSFYAMRVDGEESMPVITAQELITMEHTERLSPIKLLEDCQATPSTTTSLENQPLLSKWLNICDKVHGCTQNTEDLDDREYAPTRLIDVSMGEQSDFVRLVESKDLRAIPRYLTLSHSWGSSEAKMTVQLTRQNRLSLQKGISLTQLPRTFADTVLVSRYLGIRYIWIDSLCIIQDDVRDWETEAAMMWQVYSNAYVNVAATSSTNSSQGIFRERNPLITKPCVAVFREGHSLIPAGEYRCYNAAEWRSQIREAPLSKRAWVHQEWILSPRTIHFARDQIFWECRESCASESFPDGIPARYDTGVSAFPFGLDEVLTKDKFLEIWNSIVREYSARDLTFVSDKLVAVSALARTLSQKHPAAGTYVAGMWGNYVIDHLHWSPSHQTHRAISYRAPTWSWASMDGNIEPHFNWKHTSRQSQNQVISRSPLSVLNIDASFPKGAFDAAAVGILKVEAPLLRISIEPGEGAPDDESDLEPLQLMMNASAGTVSTREERPRPFMDREFRLRFNTWNPSPLDGTRGQLDDDRDISERPQMFFMPLLTLNEIGRRYSDEIPEVDELVGLMLEPTGSDRGQFKRCGTCSLEESMIALFLCDLGNQDLDEAMYEERRADAIGLDDIVPSNWNGKDLSFIPKRFDRFVISIV